MAAAARAGVQPLDKMVWQLKGDAPAITFFFGSHGSQAGRRITVNARTGEVLSEQPYDEDSFILKLHSGEALGDGGMVGWWDGGMVGWWDGGMVLGMLCGLALLLLTVSGIVIYFKMKPRKPPAGIRRVFWVLVGILTLALHNAARADSPFFTDDPLFSPGWEIKLGAFSEHNATGHAWAGPILDITTQSFPPYASI